MAVPHCPTCGHVAMARQFCLDPFHKDGFSPFVTSKVEDNLQELYDRLSRPPFQ